MWKRFLHVLRCPLCKGELELSVFTETRVQIAAEHQALARARGLLTDDFDHAVEAGILLCHGCTVRFPISHRLPVLLPYTTALHHEFAREFASDLANLTVQYPFPSRAPVPGERFVLSSFSTEWLEYDFDGVIWEMGYEDHERRFLAEVGFYGLTGRTNTFLEVGCGIGVTTEMAQKNFRCDGVGVDLSLAALRAATRYAANPFLHFVQASVFYLPFADASFDTVYSRGVLHHTYSTRDAFESMVRHCRPGGTTYLWVYGPRSIDDNLFRHGIHVVEKIVRPLLSRQASPWVSRVVLAPFALGYVAFNRLRRFSDPSIQPYNFRRALHAARDRFTPEYAHRHDSGQVMAWFRAAGFEQVESVDWREMPSADHDDYRRNTGVRGRKTPAEHGPAPRVAVARTGSEVAR
jgi:ubiquinone/menaquinone biosynthesis C-methylase UbiE/uncharacterized protein YbaR (Trm112 family)